jgi:hypothetical protein
MYRSIEVTSKRTIGLNTVIVGANDGPGPVRGLGWTAVAFSEIRG